MEKKTTWRPRRGLRLSAVRWFDAYASDVCARRVLASEAASYITGQVIGVDGGLL